MVYTICDLLYIYIYNGIHIYSLGWRYNQQMLLEDLNTPRAQQADAKRRKVQSQVHPKPILQRLWFRGLGYFVYGTLAWL